MNQKGFTNIILVIVGIIVLAGVAGYFVVARKPVIPTSLHTQESTAALYDSASVELTILSLRKVDSCPVEIDPLKPEPEKCPVDTNPMDTATVRVENILDYNRNPKATYPQIKQRDVIEYATFTFSARPAKVVHIPIASLSTAGSVAKSPEQPSQGTAPKAALKDGGSVPREGDLYVYSIYSGTFAKKFETVLPGINAGNRIRAQVQISGADMSFVSIGEYELLK